MNIGDLDGSDSSDEDYIPENQVLPSEEESDGDPEETLEDNNEVTNKRRSKHKQKGGKKRKVDKSEPDEDNLDENKSTNKENNKERIDSLWADFLKDTNTKPKTSIPREKKVEKVTSVYKFANEEVIVTKEIPTELVKPEVSTSSEEKPNKLSSKVLPAVPKPVASKGISSLLSQLGKKTKLSTLEKSKLDWDKFKKAEDIEEDLSHYNKGKNGYLERQDFLERADVRQFEIEKKLRSMSRSHRNIM